MNRGEAVLLEIVCHVAAPLFVEQNMRSGESVRQEKNARASSHSPQLGKIHNLPALEQLSVLPKARLARRAQGLLQQPAASLSSIQGCRARVAQLFQQA
jgi:hypothetical protein